MPRPTLQSFDFACKRGHESLHRQRSHLVSNSASYLKDRFPLSLHRRFPLVSRKSFARRTSATSMVRATVGFTEQVIFCSSIGKAARPNVVRQRPRPILFRRNRAELFGNS